MQVSFDIQDEHVEKVRSASDMLGMPLDEVARVALLDFVQRMEDFDEATSFVLKKNAELYDRLS